MDLDSFLDLQELQAGAHRRVLNDVIGGDIFVFRIQNTAVVLKKRRQPSASDIATLIDRGRQHRAAVVPVPERVIGPAAEEGNAKGSASYYHTIALSVSRVCDLYRVSGLRVSAY